MSSDTVISYPIPAYQNLPIRPDFYQPRRFDISAITLGLTTTVTTTATQDFVIGQQIRLIIPSDCGCRELNNRTGFVISLLSATQFVVDIDSRGITPFVAPTDIDQPQVLPIGDINSGVINSQGRVNNGTYIPGAFINIS